MRGGIEGRLAVAAAWCGVWSLGVLLAATALVPVLGASTAAAPRSVPVAAAAVPLDPVQVALVQVASADASTVNVTVRDTDGQVVENAVVTLAPAGGAADGPRPAGPPTPGSPPLASPPPGTGAGAPVLVDQLNEAFLPLVQAVPAGRPVAFRNSDRTLHHVYSFSPAKRFELRVRTAETSAPISFDTPGVVSLGCNIHDHMVGWLYVAETQWAAVTGPGGATAFADVPVGDYVARVWHPRLRPGLPLSATPVTLVSGSMDVQVELPLTRVRSSGRDRERSSY